MKLNEIKIGGIYKGKVYTNDLCGIMELVDDRDRDRKK